MKMRKHRREQALKCRYSFPFITTGVWFWGGRRYNEYAHKAGGSQHVKIKDRL